MTPQQQRDLQVQHGSIQLSVVIPAYNASAYISESLASVLAQTDSPPFEIIVVDDGSRDSTGELVQARFPGVRLLRKDNGGPGSARNLGVENARGEVIVFIDADDVMLPGRLAFQGAFMLQNPDYGLTFGNSLFQLDPAYDANRDWGVSNGDNFIEVPGAYGRLVVEGNFVANPACAVRRDAYLNAGRQPEDIFVGEDYAMNCAIAREWPIAASNRFLTWYRQGHGSNLMASAHTYRGPVVALQRELLAHGTRLSPEQYTRAFARWCGLANMLLRWIWIEAGRSSVLREMEGLRPLLPHALRRKWLALSVMPSSVGRVARRLKSAARSTRAPEPSAA